MATVFGCTELAFAFFVRGYLLVPLGSFAGSVTNEVAEYIGAEI